MLVVGSLVAAILSATPSAAAPGAQNGSLLSVACPTTSTCFATGTYRDAGRNAQPLVARSVDSSWEFAAAPVPPPAAGPQVRRGLLSGISCPTASRCIAVGSYTDGISRRTLIEQWDGARWTIVSRLRPKGAASSVLTAVSCAASTACVAVGSWDDVDGVTRTLAVRGNGSAWSVAATPREDTEAHDGRLTGVSCVSSTSCFAVGTFTRAQTAGVTLTERWDGKQWTLVPSPNPPRPLRFTAVAGVSCATRDACFSVGSTVYVATDPNFVETLALRWTGTRWVIAPTPKLTGRHYWYLYGVACPTTKSCFAVGERTDIDAHGVASHRTLAERWDGKSWSVMTGLDATRGMNAIACRTSTSCVAVGGSSTPGIATWNGAIWTVGGLLGARTP